MAEIHAVVTNVTIVAKIGNAIIIKDNKMILPKIISAAMAGAGAFVPYASYACTNVYIVNSSDWSIDVQRDGAGNYLTIPALQDYNFGGLTNANQIAVRLSDNVVQSVSIRAEAYS
jgi:hypothetical protein